MEIYKWKYDKYKYKYLNLKYNLDKNLNVIKLINQNNLFAIKKLQDKINQGSKFIPVIEFYEYTIDNYAYANEQNKFNGFVSSNTCSTISTMNNKNNVKNNISSCDILATSTDNKVNLNFSPLNNNYLEQFYKHLYNSYKLFSSRTGLSDIATQNDIFCPLYINEILNIANKLIEKYSNLTHEIKDLINLQDYSFIQTVNLDPQKKVIVLGDIHGSLHSFVRILFRLHRYNVINLETFTVNKQFYIIFLGDIVDRGIFSLEIVFTIMLLMYINNNDVNNPHVIYNRGNHEELSINSSQGFLKELSSRCNKENGIILHNTINSLFKLFPSSVILNIISNENKYKFWLSHGGFPMSFINKKINTKKNIIILSPKDAKQTRWADFIQYKNDSSNHFVPNVSRGVNNYETDLLILNRKHLSSFLDANHINFIIRGHQDNYYNSYLFTNKCQNKNVCGLGISQSQYLNNTMLIYNDQIEKSINNQIKTNGPIARFVIDKNIFNKGNDNGEFYYYQETNGNEIYPVITLSTNTDKDRNLFSDSFAILRFDLNINNLSDFTNNIFSMLSDLPKNLFT